VTPRRFDLIVFDWDGTLMDSAAKIVRCFQQAARDVGLKPPPDSDVRNIIGLALTEAMAILLPDVAATRREQVVQRYREHFLYLDDTGMALFPGVPEGLARLHHNGYQLAIATGKARRGLDRVLLGSPISDFFCVTRCADEALSKPHPRMLHDILACTGVPPERTIMVGDTTYDLQMAAAAAIGSIAVSYGAHERERLMAHAPLACCDSFDAVCEWLDLTRN
jgi:phosphoglycolate phosphatase